MPVVPDDHQPARQRVTVADRWRRHGHRGGVMWFTGLSGSGKSTLAVGLENALYARGFQVCSIDGDNLRHGLNTDLGFSPDDRHENIRRVGEVAALFASSGLIVLPAFISPYAADREAARATVGESFHEVFLDPGIEVCEGRDPKGLYAKARAGEIKDFTGVNAPYEAPLSPELRIDTGRLEVDAALDVLVDYAETAFKLPES